MKLNMDYDNKTIAEMYVKKCNVLFISIHYMFSPQAVINSPVNIYPANC
jgi:hypothetical protein